MAAIFQRMCYENKDQLSAGIIVAGWDEDKGPSVYNIPVGGGLFRQQWAIGGLFPIKVSTTLCFTNGNDYRLWLDICLWIL